MLKRSLHEADPSLRPRSGATAVSRRLRVEGQRGDSNKPMGAGRAGPPRVPPDFPFHQEWHGIVYATKQIRPIFVDEPEEIVVVTVYVYYLLEERR